MIKISPSLKKAVFMYGASFLGVILGFLISIFNTNLLGKEQFGDYKYIETVIRLIASIVSVGFFLSLTRIMAKNNDKEKEKKYVGLFVIVLGLISVIGTLLLIIYSLVEPLFFEENFGDIFRAYFFIVIAVVANYALLEVLKGLHKIYTLSLLTVLPFTSYLIVAYLLNKVITIRMENVLLLYYGLLFIVIIIIIFSLKPKFNYGKDIVKELFDENKHNGRPIYYGSLAGVATTHIAGLSISYYLNNTQVGFFMLALTVCSPLLIIPSVLGTTFFKKFVHLEVIPKKIIFISLAITGFALVVFFLLIDSVVLHFYSEEYMPVANIAKFLIIGFIFHGMGDLINRFLGAKGKGKMLRNAAFFTGFINIVGYTLLIKYFGMNGAIITKILASCLYLIVMLFYYINFIKKNKNVQE